MTPLEILERTFREVPTSDIDLSQPDRPGIYLLVDSDEITYVGASLSVGSRLYRHWHFGRFERAAPKQWSRGLWVPLPAKVHHHYEGAFIRALRPRDNHNAPKHRGCDEEILDGFGLSHLYKESHQVQRTRAILDPGDFARRLRSARKLSCLSVHELARMLGCCRQAIYHWETGRNIPDANRVADIARVLDCNASDLLPVTVQ